MTFAAPFSRVITRPFGGVPASGTALKTNLVAYWTLNESSDGSGAVDRLDSSGNNNTLTDYGTTPSATGLKSNGADLERDNSEFLARASTASLAMSDIDFTIAFWIKVETAQVQYIFAKGNSTAAASNYAYFSYLDASNKLYWYVSNGTSVIPVNKASVISTGNWAFVVLYHDSVNNLIGISINNGTHATAECTGGCLDNATFPQKIGNRPGNIGDYNSGFDGMMDEIGIWKRMLTASEITWLYNAGAGRTYSEF